jgi:intein-encoded DNA endonuclease-like protein
MAYILGFMYADGNIIKNKRGAYFFAVYSSDRLLLEQMLHSLKSEHKLSEKNINGRKSYSFQIGSKDMCHDLMCLGLMPNKSKRMVLPKIPEMYVNDFIRGYFDGDGNVWSGIIHKDRKNTTKAIAVAFTSVSINFLKSLHNELKRLGIMGGAISVSRDCNYGRLTLSIRDTLKIHKIMYNSPSKLYLHRKKLIFENFIKLRV